MDNMSIKRRKLREKINDEETINILYRSNIKENINCLEVGMGLGSIAKYMTKYVGRDGIVDAIDMKKDNVEYVLQNITDSNLNAYCLDVRNISKLKKKYDLVHARFVFEHLNDRENILKIIQNQMNDDGILIIEDAVYEDIEYNGSFEFKKVIKEYVHCIEFMLKDTSFHWGKEISNTMNKVGFKNIKEYGRIRVFYGGTTEADYWISCFKEYQKKLVEKGISSETLNKVYMDLGNKKNIFSGPAIFSVVCTK